MNRRAWVTLLIVTLVGCASRPREIQHKVYTFPKDLAFVDDVQRPYEVLGQVRARVDFPSLDSDREVEDLCKNYYNKGVRQLVRFAQDKGGDAVIGVRSVVFLEDGRREEYSRPECADDGAEGQILTQGVAVRWKRDPESALPSTSPTPEPRATIQPIRRRIRQGEFMPSGDPRHSDGAPDPLAQPSRIGHF